MLCFAIQVEPSWDRCAVVLIASHTIREHQREDFKNAVLAFRKDLVSNLSLYGGQINANQKSYNDKVPLSLVSPILKKVSSF
jgi:hypothetical protein